MLSTTRVATAVKLTRLMRISAAQSGMYLRVSGAAGCSAFTRLAVVPVSPEARLRERLGNGAHCLCCEEIAGRWGAPCACGFRRFREGAEFQDRLEIELLKRGEPGAKGCLQVCEGSIREGSSYDDG